MRVSGCSSSPWFSAAWSIRWSCGHWQGDLSQAGRRKSHRARRQEGRLAPDRPAVHGRQVLPAPALGGFLQRRRLRCFELGGQQLPASRSRGPAIGSHRPICQRPEEGQARRPRHRTLVPGGQVRNKPGIVAQWVNLHATVAQNWVKADPLNSAYVAEWQKSHPNEVAAWVKDNPPRPNPSPRTWPQPFFPTSPSRTRASSSKVRDDGKGLELTRKATKSARPSSTCGSATTPTPTWKRFPPTW